MDNIFKRFIVCLTLAAVIDNVSTQCSSSNRRATENVVVTQEPVSLESPGWKIAYFSNMDCRWTLTATGKKVIVDVMESYFEGSPGCSYDYLGLYDGNSISAEPTRLCNNMRWGQLYVSTGESVVIRLKSDFSVNFPGFLLRYFIGEDLSGGCSVNQAVSAATASLQYLTSPGFPDEYDVNQECSWIISSTNNKAIRIELLLLDMIDGEICYSDHLYIYDGTDDTGTLIADVCDSSAIFVDPVAYNTSSTSAFIKFVTRLHGRSRRGFLLAYNETGAAIISSQTTTTFPTYSTCSSSPVVITASSTPVYITSPDYPIFYAVNQVCQWKITAPQGSIVQIKVVDFFLEDSEACMSDNVIIYDGSTTSYPQLTRDCGEISNNVNSTGNTALISFTSDGSHTTRGFKYEITAIDGGTPVCVTGSPIDLNATTTPQYIQSVGYPEIYSSSLTEQWLIFNTLSSDYEIVIDTVDSRIENSVNCFADKVQIYQGPCTSYPSLGSFCGVSAPTYVQSNGMYVLLTFQTDSTTEYKGFNISYYLRTVTTESFFTKKIIGIIVGVVVTVVVLGIIGAVLYKTSFPKKFLKWKKSKMNGSRSSLNSSSSSSSSDSDNDKRRRQRSKRLRPIKIKPRLPSAQYTLRSKLPPIKGK